MTIQAPERFRETAERVGHADGAGERRLIDEARTDPEAFGRLYQLHHGAIASMLYRRTGDAHAAEDLAAQTFINAWKALPRFEHTGAPFRAWLMRIGTNEARRWAKQRRRRADVESNAPSNGHADSDRDAGAEVRAAIGAMSLDHQDVITLVYYESLSVEQVAAVLGVRPGTVKSRLSRAREALRNEMGRREPCA